MTDGPAARITGLDHVQLAIPAGGEPDARRFYGNLLGLEELAKPTALAGRGGCWFSGEGLDLHLGVEEPFMPAGKAHVALLVADLPAMRARLEAAGVTLTDDEADIGVIRCYALDPFGNRLELIADSDRGFSRRARP
jgi:catechol 2,3-dioxygenase-like lactoylglutathione lyase family enzyme